MYNHHKKIQNDYKCESLKYDLEQSSRDLHQFTAQARREAEEKARESLAEAIQVRWCQATSTSLWWSHWNGD